VTANMRNAIEQAAFEVGRALAKYEMLVGTSNASDAQIILAAHRGDIPSVSSPTTPDVTIGGNGTRKRRMKAAVSPQKALKEPKAPKVARGVKKASGPREKGVKNAILKLITSEPLTVGQILAKTGFKETSVRATLMGLKNANLAAPDEKKLWYGQVDQFQSRHANSETEGRNADF
jgi:hypothetical protein